MKQRGSSRLSGFHRLTVPERRAALGRWLGAGGAFEYPGAGLEVSAAERFVENAVGTFEVPLGVATNFIVNGFELLVPLAIEEPSVIAAASNAARMVREGGGFRGAADPPLTIAQVEILEAVPDAADRIAERAEEIRAAANRTQPELVGLGGGLREVEVREAVGEPGRIVVHLIVDCRDAMGANMANTMAEAVAGRLAELAGGRAGLRILSNLADRRLARAECEVPQAALSRAGFAGADVAHGVVAASDFAAADPYRAATHNKGIFNGIDAMLLATGNDWRAVEAGAHAYAARSGSYRPLASWNTVGDRLRGRIELPLAVGIVGGAARAHPVARRSIELLGVESAGELALVAASVGLATNLAALAALTSEGIQAGHMRLHRRRTDEPTGP
jgi:hydroxymethylglutaryl-CoA reductase